MGQLDLTAGLHGQRLLEARELFFQQGDAPVDLIEPTILRSWERCRRFGLIENDPLSGLSSIDRLALKTEQERNRCLLVQSRPILAHVYEQIRDSGSMVILADANGLLLETVGDPDFVGRADRVALSAGASWDENLRGTNAIGTALSEECPVEVHGGEHFLEHNAFLTCCASPIFGPDGRLVGVLDISGDYRSYQHHTLGLVRMSAALLERHLFEATHGGSMLVCFHARADYLGSPGEGIAAISCDGEILAMNRQGLKILGLRPVDAVHRDFSMVFETELNTLLDRLRLQIRGSCELRVGRQTLHLQLRGQLPTPTLVTRTLEVSPCQAPPRPAAAPVAVQSSGVMTLDHLATGDPRLQLAIDRASRILNRDIPLLIQGESGAGKEMFAKAFHQSGPRHEQAFVALNCASIPETLIESELFGYQGGAFTGARKEGSPGKIQQAHGGTLFLDEIGDMPLNLQARLLRVLQERCVTPLGSNRAIAVDISLVCATHRKLRNEVAAGRFREDLYYRLNGLAVTLPPLRERSDLRVLVGKLATAEAVNHGQPVQFTENALQCIEAYDWPGNIRQLYNVIRVTMAMLDPDEHLIDRHHLPEELLEDLLPRPAEDSSPLHDPWAPAPLDNAPGSLEEIGRQVALRTLEAAGGNISAAARQLGISRNTLYRKLGRM